MKRYTIALTFVTLVCIVASLVVLWADRGNFIVAMPLLVLYFTALTALQHWCVTTSFRKAPRDFIRNFLGITVGSLLLHFIILGIYVFTHMQESHKARLFLLSFCILYVVYLVFEIVALLRYINRHKTTVPSQDDDEPTPSASNSTVER